MSQVTIMDGSKLTFTRLAGRRVHANWLKRSRSLLQAIVHVLNVHGLARARKAASGPRRESALKFGIPLHLNFMGLSQIYLSVLALVTSDCMPLCLRGIASAEFCDGPALIAHKSV